jgi:hypothetical protein
VSHEKLKTALRLKILREIWKPPERFSEPPISPFAGCSGNPKAITAFWKVWRCDADYRRDWEDWRKVDAYAGRVRECVNLEWRRWKREPISKEHPGVFSELLKLEYESWKLKDDFLSSFAKCYAIPPMNPDSKDIGGDVAEAISAWKVGQWNRSAWPITSKGEDEIADMDLLGHRVKVVINLGADIEEIVEAMREIVVQQREVKRVRGCKRTHSHVEKYDDYVRAWYLAKVKGLKNAAVSRTLFGRGDSNTLKKTRLYISAGAQLHRGSPQLIRGKKTPGYSPQKEQRLQAELEATMKRVQRGGSKAKK